MAENHIFVALCDNRHQGIGNGQDPASNLYWGARYGVAKAYPLLWTTNLMCPEAYTLEAALAGWIHGETHEEIHTRAAAAYSRYQHCSVAAAGRLLKTGW